MANVTLTLGERITELRKAKRMTQTEFGKLFGVKYQMVSAWENDSRIPSVEVIQEMSELFNVSRYYLETGIEDDNHVVCEELGLSNETINILKETKEQNPLIEYYREAIDLLVNRGTVLFAIWRFLTDQRSSDKYATKYTDDEGHWVYLEGRDFDRINSLFVLDELQRTKDEIKEGRK